MDHLVFEGDCGPRRRRGRGDEALPDLAPRMRSAAARALCQLARELQCRNAIWNMGGIERLVAVVRTADDRVEPRGRDKAAQAIANLAARDDGVKFAIAAADAIPALVGLLASQLSQLSVRPFFASAAATLSQAHGGRDARRGGLGRGAENAAAALSNLAADRAYSRPLFGSLLQVADERRLCPKRLIVEAGALPLLVRRVARSTREVRAGSAARVRRHSRPRERRRRAR